MLFSFDSIRFQVIMEKTEFQSIFLAWDNKDLDLLSEITKLPYFDQCVYLSWLMAVQDPPMFMDVGPSRRSYINRDHYQEFTKKGSIVDYCVWPALFIEKDGPLTTKGVVQVYQHCFYSFLLEMMTYLQNKECKCLMFNVCFKLTLVNPFHRRIMQ